jgi:hypothetical protein
MWRNMLTMLYFIMISKQHELYTSRFNAMIGALISILFLFPIQTFNPADLGHIAFALIH